MNKDLQSYVKVYNDWIEKDKCVETIEEIKKDQWFQHAFYNQSQNSLLNLSGNKELDTSFSIPSTYDHLNKRIWESIYKYLKELEFSWYAGWTGSNRIRFNHYKPGRLMALHCDHINSMFDGTRKGIPVLSVLGVLNDEYEGGEFVMWEDTVIPLKTGDVMIFPSNFLYPHHVTEVTKGDRYTMVTWVF